MAFRGTFDYALDAKNRLTVPAKFRKQLAEGVVLAKGTATCISVWSPEDFDAYLDSALAAHPALSDAADEINRFFQANSFDTEIDSAGRIALPPKLLEHAGLTKEVVVTGVGRRLEIWDRQTWADYNAGLDIHAITTGHAA